MVYRTRHTKRESRKKFTGASVSLVFHIILIVICLIYLVPTKLEKRDEIIVNLNKYKDIQLEEFEEEEIDDLSEVVEDTSEEVSPVEVTPEVEVNDTLEFDELNMDYTVDSNDLVDVSVTASYDPSIKGVMVKKYGKSAAKNGLLGSYFGRYDFFGKAFTRIDKTLNKPLSTESPWPGKVPPVCYSVIWTGRIVPKQGGVYTLYLSSDLSSDVVWTDVVWTGHRKILHTLPQKYFANLRYYYSHLFNSEAIVCC